MDKTSHRHQTIAAAAVDLIRQYERGEADAVVEAVHREFPKSKFNRAQFHYYKSQLRRGKVGRSRGKGRKH